MRGVLALDQGGHASRACLFNEAGDLIAERQRPVRTNRHGSDEVEHDADELAESLLRAAHELLEQYPTLQVERAALSTQRSTIVCFQRSSGAALAPALSWQDRRNAAWLESFTAQRERIAAITGLPLSPHYGAGKIRWCLDHLPLVQRAQLHGDLVAGPLAAFLVARLTRADACVDPANASRTLLFDAARLQWSEELTNLFAIDRSVLPRCTPTRAHFGILRIADREVALQALTGDQSAVPFAYGSPDPQTIYINLGTGAFIQRPLRELPQHSGLLLRSVLAADEEQRWYCLEGTVNGAGSAVSWYVQQCGADETALWRALEHVATDAVLPLFINGIGGLGSPYWRPDLRSRFIGAGSLLERFAAVLESVVFLIAVNFAAMNAPATSASLGLADGAPLKRVIVTGGLSRSDWLCKRLAAMLETPVLRIAPEATARGAAALAAPMLAQNWPLPQVSVFEPSACNAATERQSRYSAALAADLRS